MVEPRSIIRSRVEVLADFAGVPELLDDPVAVMPFDNSLDRRHDVIGMWRDEEVCRLRTDGFVLLERHLNRLRALKDSQTQSGIGGFDPGVRPVPLGGGNITIH